MIDRVHVYKIHSLMNKTEQQDYKKLVDTLQGNKLFKDITLDETELKNICDIINSYSDIEFAADFICGERTEITGKSFNKSFKLYRGDREILRNFRDNVLEKSYLGRNFISWYYKNREKIFHILDNNHVVNKLVRNLIIMPVIWIIKKSK